MQRVASTRAEWRASSHCITDEKSGLSATMSFDVAHGTWRWTVQRGATVLDASMASSESLAREAAERTLAWIRDKREAVDAYREAGVVCPNCGYFGALPPSRSGDSAFRYLLDVVVHRAVGELNSQKLCIRSAYGGEELDDGTNPRLECGNCCTDFPVPPALSIAWT